MRKFYSLLTLLVLAIVSPVARAEVVSPYSFDFSGLDTSSHSFAPSGWGHIVESYDDYEYGNTDYVEYTQKRQEVSTTVHVSIVAAKILATITSLSTTCWLPQR